MVLKHDERGQPATVAVFLDRAQTCIVKVGDLPRICSFSKDRREVTCKDHDGSKVHRVFVRRQEQSVEVWVEAPEQTVRLVTVAL